MRNTKTAFFVKYPRTISDLQTPHLLRNERPYEIVTDIRLPAIDYENFITDMLADRQFIESCAATRIEDKVMNCLFVHRRSEKCGILVISDAPQRIAHVKWAAYIEALE